MALKGSFRGRSRKKSTAGTAFDKGNGTHKSAGTGRFGNISFLKRLFGKAGKDVENQNSSGQTELILMAQLGDSDAIQALIDSGMDAKDNLGLSSLAALALTGDMDAVRLLAGRGLGITKKVAVDIDAERSAALRRLSTSAF